VNARIVRHEHPGPLPKPEWTKGEGAQRRIKLPGPPGVHRAPMLLFTPKRSECSTRPKYTRGSAWLGLAAAGAAPPACWLSSNWRRIPNQVHGLTDPRGRIGAGRRRASLRHPRRLPEQPAGSLAVQAGDSDDSSSNASFSGRVACRYRCRWIAAYSRRLARVVGVLLRRIDSCDS
jgi:hypothetical protein